MKLGFDLQFEALYRRDGLAALDRVFIARLAEADVALHNRLLAARVEPQALSPKEHSQLLIALAPHVEDVIGELFGIRPELAQLAERHHQLAPLYACKRNFVQRRAAKAIRPEEAARINGDAVLSMLPLPYVPSPIGGGLEPAPHVLRGWGQSRIDSADNAPLPTSPLQGEETIFELVFAKSVMGWLENEAAHKPLLEMATRYAGWALYSEEGQTRHADGLLFKQPKKLDFAQLVPVATEERAGITVMKAAGHTRVRDGFALTDDGGHLKHALDHAHYCIVCHHQGKDSCSKGMREKDDSFKKNALSIPLNGCPLEEKISEMNELKAAGVPLGALAMVVVDNPMCAGTGHRICNDCMKSCIYQKQEPVNIPLVETHVLRDVLSLPYGFEVYSLLTRWNPLNLARPLPLPDSGRKVLVAGLGPAGYTLAHHLMNDGHTVVAIDGLKIEPLAERISGVDARGARVAFEPIRDVQSLYTPLDTRPAAGFGGVAEYGITVRWDKNYLTLIRLLLERRAEFAMVGGVRFGGTLTYEGAFALGFDHVALCMGAGKPTLIDMPNGLARGVRTASDFLMALQLTGAARRDSIANLQLRLPVVVIGGGLTAIDTATEALAYYPVQVEKFLARYEALAATQGEEALRAGMSEEEKIIADEFISHAKQIREEKKKPTPDVLSLLKGWGGSTLVYRKRLVDAPSYRLNHEEVEKALEEGIFIAEQLEPVGVVLDAFGHASGVQLRAAKHQSPGTSDEKESTLAPSHSSLVTLPTRTILLAAGTNANTVLSREDPLHFVLDGKYFRAVDASGAPVTPERSAKPAQPQVLLSVDEDGRSVSFFGDLHPSYAGNVVKAMASAKQGYPSVSRILARRIQDQDLGIQEFLAHVNSQLRATVHEVNRLTPTIVEVVIHAPLAAQQFQPGQFYRLQNYEKFALRTTNHESPTTTLAMEGLAMTGAWVDKERGLVSVIALEMGGSSSLCAYLKPGEPVVLMGPTGTPTHIPKNENVLLVGGGLGNAVLFSIGKAMRENGCKVLYFAGYKKAIDRYKLDEIEAAADQVVWCCDETLLDARRPQDSSFHGNIVEAIRAYAENRIQDSGFRIQEKRDEPLNPESRILIPSINHLIVIGSDRMMAAVAYARHHQLKDYLNPAHTAIGSINSPMQCMMKEICAQCLQKHIDPQTGEEYYVYSCFNQDQPLDAVSWPHLAERLSQNALQEKLGARWIAHCLQALG